MGNKREGYKEVSGLYLNKELYRQLMNESFDRDITITEYITQLLEGNIARGVITSSPTLTPMPSSPNTSSPVAPTTLSQVKSELAKYQSKAQSKPATTTDWRAEQPYRQKYQELVSFLQSGECQDSKTLEAKNKEITELRSEFNRLFNKVLK